MQVLANWSGMFDVSSWDKVSEMFRFQEWPCLEQELHNTPCLESTISVPVSAYCVYLVAISVYTPVEYRNAVANACLIGGD